MRGAMAPGSPGRRERKRGRRNRPPACQLCPASHRAASFSKAPLTSLMGALGSVLGPLAQSADGLTHQNGEHGPAVGCGWGQTSSW